MATWEYELAEPPSEPRARELWLQHAAGFIIFEDVRRYATEQMDPNLSDDQRSAVQKGIDDAVYGLMMIIDGVTGGITNSSRSVSIDFIARLARCPDGQDGEVLSSITETEAGSPVLPGCQRLAKLPARIGFLGRQGA